MEKLNTKEDPPFPGWEVVKLVQNIPVSINTTTPFIRISENRPTHREMPIKGWNNAELYLGTDKFDIVIDDANIYNFKVNSNIFEKVLFCETNIANNQVIDADANLVVPPGYRHSAIVLDDLEIVLFFIKNEQIKKL